MDSNDLKRRYYPEVNIGGFSHVDGTVVFFSHLAAIVRPTDIILDFGAGRGAPFLEDTVIYRRNLGNFKGRCQHLDGCDIDPAVLDNPFVDEAKLIRNGEPLPYENDRFDLIVARFVFEHLESPNLVVQELLRITKPGGIIAATTPNKWGYIAMAARLVPNRYHARVLSKIQTARKEEDIYATFYRLNTRRALEKAFGDQAELFIAPKASEPAYHFGNPTVYRLLKFANKHLPDRLMPLYDVYARKI